MCCAIVRHTRVSCDRSAVHSRDGVTNRFAGRMIDEKFDCKYVSVCMYVHTLYNTGRDALDIARPWPIGHIRVGGGGGNMPN